ncbi:MAG TPA: 50S ribosomal protein L11 methyltransferase [Gemmatimonadales bacterium]|nr:50S ribosomal protein L11 methyltransferase [Gemmatimonadales bacterium]
MTSWAVDVASPADERDAVGAWLVGRTGEAVEERDDGTLVAVVESEARASELLAGLAARFGADVTGSSRALPDLDWRTRWKDGLGPRRLGRLTVTPSWIPLASPREHTVIIDPETAFGTGEHGSTRTALVLLDRAIQPGDRVLDLGSGSGILAIAAAKLGAARAVGVDHDAEAEPVARSNADGNRVADRVRFLTGDAELLAPLLGPVELILSNILRSLNESLLPVIRGCLVRGGTAIFAGMEHSEREQFLAVLEPAGFAVTDEARDDAWWGVTARVI